MVQLVVAAGLLLRECDDKAPAHGGDPERGVAGRQVRIDETSGRRPGAPARVEDVDLPADEVGRVELRLIASARKRKAFVDGAVRLDSDDRVSWSTAGLQPLIVPLSLAKMKA
jgi:hypothetical protein